MNTRLNTFVEAHPEGWNHADWIGLLGELEQDGVDVSDTDAVGLELERHRLAWTLAQADVKGLGPKRIAAIEEEFRTLWNLRQAGADRVAQLKNVPRDLAERIVEALGPAE